VFIVADGMGGHDAGDRASSIAVEEMGKLGPYPQVEDVRDALTRARAGIDHLEVTNARRAAGTTISGLVLVQQADQPYWLVLNLGDSRTYRATKSEVTQISVDHSEVQEMIEAGRLDVLDAQNYGRRHVITRVLGGRTVERPEYWLFPVQGPERWMICSDGLTEELNDDVIAHILRHETFAQDAVNKLVEAALEAGGRDNISVIVVDVKDADESEDEETIEEVIGDWRFQPGRVMS
jgi:protein phosphatase